MTCSAARNDAGSGARPARRSRAGRRARHGCRAAPAPGAGRRAARAIPSTHAPIASRLARSGRRRPAVRSVLSGADGARARPALPQLVGRVRQPAVDRIVQIAAVAAASRCWQPRDDLRATASSFVDRAARSATRAARPPAGPGARRAPRAQPPVAVRIERWSHQRVERAVAVAACRDGAAPRGTPLRRRATSPPSASACARERCGSGSRRCASSARRIATLRAADRAAWRYASISRSTARAPMTPSRAIAASRRPRRPGEASTSRRFGGGGRFDGHVESRTSDGADRA